MSKERLEDAKKDYQKIINLDYEGKFNDAMVLKRLFFENHGKWLIEQAERGQELEEKSKERENELIRILTNRYKYITQLENTEIILSEKIKRHHRTLGFYADRKSWELGDPYEPRDCDAWRDQGSKARQALEDEE